MTDTPTPTTTSDERPPRRGPRDAQSWVPALAVLVVVSLAVAGFALSRSPRASAATSPAGTITVTGTGTIQGTPDTVQFSIGIHTVRTTAVLALEANNQQVTRLEAALAARGALYKGMQTTNVSIYEQTNRYGEFTGFAVDDDLQVSVTTKVAGRVIDAGVRVAGGSLSFNGVSFSISNESKLLASARARAMQDALTAAKQLASGGGETVGSIVRVTDQEASQVQYQYPDLSAGMALNTYADARIPLEAGRQPVSVNVTVVYALNS